MIKYMLDTNIIAYAINKSSPEVISNLLKHNPEEICISAITMAELEYGIMHSSKPERNRAALMMFLAEISVVSFDSNAAYDYGVIRQDLQNKGQLIGANDMLIAAQARSLGVTLVTHNVREISRVENLKYEDWCE
ncbi:tRNA(fMet)-specific endonuclease VapC [Lachnospiraceae bacterium G41]|nr:tRNA(fMet)-specific endonuclease VapC [Lachnospiraceae bacterium G41]